jgi:hypothetical protein
MKVYLVSGVSGSYDSYNECIAAAYLDKDKASAHAVLANAEFQRIEKDTAGDIIRRCAAKNKYDEDWAGREDTEYRWFELDILTEVP